MKNMKYVIRKYECQYENNEKIVSESNYFNLYAKINFGNNPIVKKIFVQETMYIFILFILFIKSHFETFVFCHFYS